MKMKAYESFEQYLSDQAPGNRTVLRALRQFVARTAPQLQESVKWGNGCWLREKTPVAYVYSASDHVQFGFFNGAALKDPTRLLIGRRKVRAAHQGVETLRHRRKAIRRPSASGSPPLSS